jgi:hypothetical protein
MKNRNDKLARDASKDQPLRLYTICTPPEIH